MGEVLKKIGAKVIGFVVLVVVVFGIGALSASGSNSIFSFGGLKQSNETHTSEVINAVRREEQIVLLALGIQGITESSGESSLFGLSLPGSQRVAFMQYSFDAKLGIEGKDVAIKETGANKYLVKVPDFIFIGHNNEHFDVVAEDNGVLSWITQENDVAEMINGILSSDLKDEYIAKNQDLLTEQVESFYKGIILSVDPTAEVLFKY